MPAKVKHRSNIVPGSTYKPTLFGGCLPRLSRMLSLNSEEAKKRPNNMDGDSGKLTQSSPFIPSNSLAVDIETCSVNVTCSAPNTPKLLSRTLSVEKSNKAPTATSKLVNENDIHPLLNGRHSSTTSSGSKYKSMAERYGVLSPNGPRQTSFTPGPLRRFHTNSSVNRTPSRSETDDSSKRQDDNSEAGDSAIFRNFLSTSRAGRIRRSISSDPIYRPLPTNAFSRMKQAALERGENLSQVQDASERMMNSGMAFSQLARQIAEREKNKRWYQW